MARRRAYVHIGLAGTGGAFLGAALAHHADALHEQGVSVPARSTEEMFHAALEMRRDHKSWGLRRRDVEGAWARVCRRAFKDRGTVVVGHELLAACPPEQIALLLDGLAGLEVHLVVTARDPATQSVACWTDTLDSGSATPFDDFHRRITDPGRAHQQAHEFWTAQALDEVLERWTAAVGDPGRVHVVVPPADDPDPRPAIWRAVGRLVGFDADALPPALPTSTAPGSTGPSLLRSVNAAVDGRLGTGDHRRVVRELLAASGATATGERPVVPPERYDDLLEVAERWTKLIADAGHDVLGDPTDLLPRPPVAEQSATGQSPAEEPSAEERLARTTDVLADVLVEVVRLREHAAALEEHNARLRRKRRRLKQRLADATSG